ncbi:MAG TPA: hypothetical protein VMF13_00295 [Luteitalea sp.]|nr:hypothetical protein [Luteitalea sp.]
MAFWRATSTLVLGLILATLPVQGQSPAPLPELEQLIKDVRAGLRTDEALLRQYTFRERRRDVKMTKLGKVQLGPWRAFEVYPSEVPGETYKRLVSVDDKPLAKAELDQRDAAHRQGVLDRLAQIEAETPAQKQKRLAKRAKERQEEQDVIDDVFATYTIAIVGRETVDGRPAIVTTLTPRPNAKTKSDAGRFLKKIRGKAWVSEADRQVMRVEMEAIEDITFGLGLLARMHKGSTMLFRRTLVNGEIWLPAEARFRLVGKTLIFRKFALESATQFSDYKKFNVSTSEEISDEVK